jgi:hypothetical protein
MRLVALVTANCIEPGGLAIAYLYHSTSTLPRSGKDRGKSCRLGFRLQINDEP